MILQAPPSSSVRTTLAGQLHLTLRFVLSRSLLCGRSVECFEVYEPAWWHVNVIFSTTGDVLALLRRFKGGAWAASSGVMPAISSHLHVAPSSDPLAIIFS